MDLIDYVIFFLYLFGIAFFGLSFYKKTNSAESFATGNKILPRWVISFSIFATYLSSISFLALPGSAYGSNWSVFVYSISIPIAIYITSRYFIPIYRKLTSASAYEYLEDRFGLWARIYVSIFFVLTQVMRIGVILYLLAIIINTITQWNLVMVIVITGIIVLLYSMIGGIQAVAWTDAIQGIVLTVGVLFCIIFLILKIPGGISTISEVGIENNKFSLGSFKGGWSESTFWVVLIYGIFNNVQNFGVDQNYVQRYIASKNENSAKRSLLIGGLMYIPISLLFLIVGTLLFVYYYINPEILPLELQSGNKSDLIFPHFIVNELPKGGTGLLISSIFAAGMSTISTSFNSGSTILYYDYYLRLIYKGDKLTLNSKRSLYTIYIINFLFCLLGISVAIFMINVESALDAWWAMASIFSGGMLGVFILGMFSRFCSSKIAFISTMVGFLVLLGLTILPFVNGRNENFVHSYLVTVISTVIITVVGYILTWISRFQQP